MTTDEIAEEAVRKWLSSHFESDECIVELTEAIQSAIEKAVSEKRNEMAHQMNCLAKDKSADTNRLDWCMANGWLPNRSEIDAAMSK